MPKRVLVVDDDPPVVELLRQALSDAGFQVEAAPDGAHALLAIDALRPDLVVLDAMMPVMDGFQVLRTLRERPATADLPVVMLTSLGGDADVTRGWAGGVDCYLTKPFDIGEVIAMVTRMVESDGGEPAG
jgi:DNA-binding response OmpR family regulator